VVVVVVVVVVRENDGSKIKFEPQSFIYIFITEIDPISLGQIDLT
jgi:hypothetical protein